MINIMTVDGEVARVTPPSYTYDEDEDGDWVIRRPDGNVFMYLHGEGEAMMVAHELNNLLDS